LTTSGKTAGAGVKTADRLRDQDNGVAARTLTHWGDLRKMRAICVFIAWFWRRDSRAD